MLSFVGRNDASYLLQEPKESSSVQFDWSLHLTNPHLSALSIALSQRGTAYKMRDSITLTISGLRLYCGTRSQTPALTDLHSEDQLGIDHYSQIFND